MNGLTPSPILARLAGQAEDDVVAGPAVVDRFDGRLQRRQGEERDHLPEVATQLVAQILDRAVDVARNEGVAERRGPVSNGGLVHPATRPLRVPLLSVPGGAAARGRSVALPGRRSGCGQSCGRSTTMSRLRSGSRNTNI